MGATQQSSTTRTQKPRKYVSKLPSGREILKKIAGKSGDAGTSASNYEQLQQLCMKNQSELNYDDAQYANIQKLLRNAIMKKKITSQQTSDRY